MSNDNPPADEGFSGENKTGNPVEKNLKSGTTWMRALFMVISWIFLSVATFAGAAIVVIGFFWVLFTGDVNPQIREAGQSVATYIYNITRFLTYNTEEKPFPLGGEWPSGSAESGQ